MAAAIELWFLSRVTLRDDQSTVEEWVNGLTHVLGAVLAAIGTVALTVRAVAGGSHVDVAAALIFGISMVALFSCSAAYHLTRRPVAKRLLRVMDHVSIYLLIAGTYTPITLGVGGRLGWAVFFGAWGLALIGIVITFAFWGRLKALHIASYLAVGWAGCVAWGPFTAAMTRELLTWCVVGGVVYSGGVLAYLLRKLPFHHALWHLFVLAGSICFFVGIYRNLLLLPVS